MRLYEFEGKELLKKYGVPVPDSRLIRWGASDSGVSTADESTPSVLLQSGGGCMAKAQVLSGLRGKHGGIKRCCTLAELQEGLSMLGSTFNNEPVHALLLEQVISFSHQYYVSFVFDTDTRSPMMILSAQGGIAIEDNVTSGTGTMVRIKIDPLLGLQEWNIREAAVSLGLSKEQTARITPVLLSFYRCFEQEDAVQVEVNPLVEVSAGESAGAFIALDAKIELCDDGAYRHKERVYSPRVAGFARPPTERELLVKEVNAKDYRGTVKYIELDGDIGFLAASGGGSITCMDALMSCGGRPSNYTEFSGSPPTEKVYHLTKALLSKPGLRGLWIVGAIANFTRVDETLQGVAQALEEIKPGYPIVVRRSGPNEEEGLEILRRTAAACGLDLVAYGAEMPMTKTAKILMDKVNNVNGHIKENTKENNTIDEQEQRSVC
ncbi:hypothetical protein HYU19_03140 [Candidatus Woesearchaeota archaeon]|nr:hypothetical protein [Candidatus Woesearchaeota archaeon]